MLLLLLDKPAPDFIYCSGSENKKKLPAGCTCPRAPKVHRLLWPNVRRLATRHGGRLQCKQRTGDRVDGWNALGSQSGPHGATRAAAVTVLRSNRPIVAGRRSFVFAVDNRRMTVSP
jgi:hypothetical protein